MERLPEVVFLDWHNTLSRSTFWGHVSEKHPQSEIYKKISQCLFVDNADLINPWMRGKYEAWEICTKISDKTGISYGIVYDGLVQSCREMQLVSDSIPEIIQRLRESGMAVLVATDNMDTFRNFTVEGMKLKNMFDGFLISYEVGSLKQDSNGGIPLFFNTYMKENNIDYSSAILFDDSGDKSGLLTKSGMKVVQITGASHLVQELEKLIS